MGDKELESRDSVVNNRTVVGFTCFLSCQSHIMMISLGYIICSDVGRRDQWSGAGFFCVRRADVEMISRFKDFTRVQHRVVLSGKKLGMGVGFVLASTCHNMLLGVASLVGCERRERKFVYGKNVA